MDGDVGRHVYYRLPSGEEDYAFLWDTLYPNHGSIHQELALNELELQDLLHLAKQKDPHVQLSDIHFTVVRDGVPVEFTVGQDDTDAIPDREAAVPVGFRLPTIKNIKKPDRTINLLDPKASEDDILHSCPMSPTRFELRPNYKKGESSSSPPRHCVVCLDGEIRELVENRDGNGSGCGHLYCPDCLRSYLGKEMNEHLTPVMCPEKNCDQSVMIWDLCGMIGVPKEVKDRWERAVQEAAILIRVKKPAYPTWI